MRRLVIATRNRGKLEEIREILSELNISVESLSDYPCIGEIEETGETFIENALEKAIAVAKHTRQVALADDSGLVVDALGGAPGVSRQGMPVPSLTAKIQSSSLRWTTPDGSAR